MGKSYLATLPPIAFSFDAACTFMRIVGEIGGYCVCITFTDGQLLDAVIDCISDGNECDCLTVREHLDDGSAGAMRSIPIDDIKSITVH
jgi:hypothetical protein